MNFVGTILYCVVLVLNGANFLIYLVMTAELLSKTKSVRLQTP